MPKPANISLCSAFAAYMCTPDAIKSTTNDGKSTTDDGKSTPNDGKSTSDDGKSTSEQFRSTPKQNYNIMGSFCTVNGYVAIYYWLLNTLP